MVRIGGGRLRGGTGRRAGGEDGDQGGRAEQRIQRHSLLLASSGQMPTRRYPRPDPAV